MSTGNSSAPLSDEPGTGVEADELRRGRVGALVFAHVRPGAIVELIRVVRNLRVPLPPTLHLSQT